MFVLAISLQGGTPPHLTSNARRAQYFAASAVDFPRGRARVKPTEQPTAETKCASCATCVVRYASALPRQVMTPLFVAFCFFQSRQLRCRGLISFSQPRTQVRFFTTYIADKVGRASTQGHVGHRSSDEGQAALKVMRDVLVGHSSCFLDDEDNSYSHLSTILLLYIYIYIYIFLGFVGHSSCSLDEPQLLGCPLSMPYHHRLQTHSSANRDPVGHSN